MHTFVAAAQARTVLGGLHVRGMSPGLGPEERLHVLNTMASTLDPKLFLAASGRHRLLVCLRGP